MNASKWAVGSHQYRNRQRAVGAQPEVTLRPMGSEDRAEQWAYCGITWDPEAIDVSEIQASSSDRSRRRFLAQLPELIWNTAALEGNTYTLPEVRTLLEGVTVGGRPLRDAEQILALRDAYQQLDDRLASGTFELSKNISDELHALVARHEAIEFGHFRGQGSVTGGGHVRTSDGGRVQGIEHGEGGAELLGRHERLLEYTQRLPDARMQALVYFAAASRIQYYFDGNKRTARLMMAGHLIASGFDAISVPNSRRHEFNTSLDELFRSDDATPLMAFLASCTI